MLKKEQKLIGSLIMSKMYSLSDIITWNEFVEKVAENARRRNEVNYRPYTPRKATK